jgi:hypothetical protein
MSNTGGGIIVDAMAYFAELTDLPSERQVVFLRGG